MNNRHPPLFSLVLVLAASSISASAQVVVPNAYVASEGGSNNSFPFRYTQNAGHYQQSFEALQFPGPILIDEIAYRYLGDGSAGASTADFKMTFSYCASSWNTLSGTFANNVGAGATVVYDGVWNVEAFNGDAGLPNPFTQRLHLTTPFFYDPSQGDLLMDVEMRKSTYPVGGIAGAFESAYSNQGVNRVFKDDGNPTSLSGSVSTSGLITEFVSGGVNAYGVGCAGAGGIVPELSWTGAPSLGSQISLNLVNGLGGAPSVTLIGVAEVSVPVGGACTLLVGPPYLQLFIPLGGSGAGNGSYTLPGVIPLSSPLGTIRLQAFIADASTPVGLAATNGLAVTIQ